MGGPAEGAAAAGGAGKRRLGGALPRKPGLPSALPVESRAGTEAGGRASLAGQLRGSPTSLSVGFLLWGRVRIGVPERSGEGERRAWQRWGVGDNEPPAGVSPAPPAEAHAVTPPTLRVRARGPGDLRHLWRA